MELTKAKCVFALAGLYSAANGEHDEENKDVLEQLINKYFNNPPLKFEDLEPDMWVWDNVSKRYIKIFDISYSDKSFNVNGEWPLDEFYLEDFDFEDNRFYLKAVKEQ